MSYPVNTDSEVLLFKCAFWCMKNSHGIYPISYVLLDHFVIQFFEENIQLKQIWAEMKIVR